MKKFILILVLIFSIVAAHTQSWLINGNTGTNPDSNFIGTIDYVPLNIRVNNAKSGQINMATLNTSFGWYSLANTTSSGYYNTGMGAMALYTNTTGLFNTGTGAASLYSNTSGRYNTATGYSALYSNSVGYYNTADGNGALYANTVGNYNTASGYYSLYSNYYGSQNTALGSYALYYNTTANNNTAVGHYALRANTTGSDQTAVGVAALRENTTGIRNNAFGSLALMTNYTGSYNVAIGSYTLGSTTASNNNTAVGYSAGHTPNTNINLGWNNTLIGAYAMANANDRYNCVALGQGTTCTGSNQARIGNSSTTSIGGYVGWSNISDGRFKKNIQANVKGLDFIMRLQPVTYNLDVKGLRNKLNEGRDQGPDEYAQRAVREKEKVLYSGFVAQDVEKAAKESGYEFSGIDKPQDEKDLYGLRYAEFVVPLVKAMQEQQAIIAQLESRIAELEKKQGLAVSSSETNQLTVWPNPGSGDIFINIQASQSAKGIIQITDSKGVLLKQQQANLVQGNNQVKMSIKDLTAGAYFLSAEWNGAKKTAQIVRN